MRRSSVTGLSMVGFFLLPSLAFAHDPHGWGVAAVVSLPITFALGILLVIVEWEIGFKTDPNPEQKSQSACISCRSDFGCSHPHCIFSSVLCCDLFNVRYLFLIEPFEPCCSGIRFTSRHRHNEKC